MFAPRAFLLWGGVAIGEEHDLGDEHRRTGRPGPPYEEALKRLEGHEAREREAAIPSTRSDAEIERSLEIGLPAAEFVGDRIISTFVRADGTATLRRDEHVYGLSVRGGRVVGWELRRGDTRGAAGHRDHLPSRFSLQAAGHQVRLGALRHRQLRDGHRHPGAAPGRGRRRRLRHPGQYREELRPDRTRGQSRCPERRFPGDPGRRPLDRLSGHAWHRAPHRRQRRDHPPRPARGHPGEGDGQADAPDAVVPRHEHPERPAEEPGAVRHRGLAGPEERRTGRPASARRRS
jgi:hypothetical protein